MTTKRLLISICLANSVLGPAWTAFAADGAPARSKVAVVDAIELPERMEATRARLNDLLGEAVRKRVFDLIRPAEGPSCADASCLPDFAKASGATDLLIARGGRNGSYGYHVEAPGSGTPLPARPCRRSADCSVCSGPRDDRILWLTQPRHSRIGWALERPHRHSRRPPRRWQWPRPLFLVTPNESATLC